MFGDSSRSTPLWASLHRSDDFGCHHVSVRRKKATVCLKGGFVQESQARRVRKTTDNDDAVVEVDCSCCNRP